MAEENKALAQRWHLDIFQQGNFAAADEILTEDFVWHSLGLPPDWLHGPEGAKLAGAYFRHAFPDVEITHHRVIAEGDIVVIRWSFTGTHMGELLGVPASGKRMNLSGFDQFRIEGGKIAEMWQSMDMLSLIRFIVGIRSP